MESRGGKILVVDADSECRLLLKAELEALQCHVILAANGKQAVQALEQEPFDVALIDLTLPDADGLEVLQKARQQDPSLETIIMAGPDALSTAVSAIEIGVIDYVTKPFAHAAVVAQRVSRAIAQRRQQAALRSVASQLEGSSKQLATGVQALKQLYLETVRVISGVLELRDADQGRANEHVRALAVAVAAKLGVEINTVEWLSLAALLRDVGHVGPIDDVVKKRGPLDAAELESVRRHPDVGSDLMQAVEAFEPMARIIRHHHERFDGKGYPEGLSGQGIPLPARILAIADAYVAMTSDRPHREKMSGEEAMAEVRQGAGTQFDPEVVEAFVDVVERLVPISGRREETDRSG